MTKKRKQSRIQITPSLEIAKASSPAPDLPDKPFRWVIGANPRPMIFWEIEIHQSAVKAGL